MNKSQRPALASTVVAAALALSFSGAAFAKLPPLSDEAKAKAAEAAAKTAHNGKVDNYKLCQSMDKVAAYYYASSKKAGKETKPATETPACADPGAFVYPPPAAAAPGAAAAPATAAAKPAAAAAPAPKK
jgi:hypothetical protein